MLCQFHDQSNGAVIHSCFLATIPRKGEYVKLCDKGTIYEVVQIIHDVYESKVRVTVRK